MPPHATTTLGPYKDINFLNITDKIPEEYLSTALLGCTLSELVASPNLGCISNCLAHIDCAYAIPYEMQLQTLATNAVCVCAPAITLYTFQPNLYSGPPSDAYRSPFIALYDRLPAAVYASVTKGLDVSISTPAASPTLTCVPINRLTAAAWARESCPVPPDFPTLKPSPFLAAAHANFPNSLPTTLSQGSANTLYSVWTQDQTGVRWPNTLRPKAVTADGDATEDAPDAVRAELYRQLAFAQHLHTIASEKAFAAFRKEQQAFAIALADFTAQPPPPSKAKPRREAMEHSDVPNDYDRLSALSCVRLRQKLHASFPDHVRPTPPATWIPPALLAAIETVLDDDDAATAKLTEVFFPDQPADAAHEAVVAHAQTRTPCALEYALGTRLLTPSVLQMVAAPSKQEHEGGAGVFKPEAKAEA